MIYDIVGIGLGPSNLSLAALSKKHKNIKSIFLEQNSEFHWHSEQMFDDGFMQTHYLKDLVTLADPTSSYSFINYLHSNHQLYSFLNTRRCELTRREFQDYCRWITAQLTESIRFNTTVHSVEYIDDYFRIDTNNGELKAKNICLGTGQEIKTPENMAIDNKNIFSIKSKQLVNTDFTDQNILIVGGGQTGLEYFRNALRERWGRAKHINFVTKRNSLHILDEGSFTDEVYTPKFSQSFYKLPIQQKKQLNKELKLSSDGNTPKYITQLYNDLYLDRFYDHKFCSYKILNSSKLIETKSDHGKHIAIVSNAYTPQLLELEFDKLILATGFQSKLPIYLEKLYPQIENTVNEDYSLSTSLPSSNKIFVMNMSRDHHGIGDSQITLMPWRSSQILNSLLGEEVYRVNKSHTFLNF